MQVVVVQSSDASREFSAWVRGVVGPDDVLLVAGGLNDARAMITPGVHALILDIPSVSEEAVRALCSSYPWLAVLAAAGTEVTEGVWGAGLQDTLDPDVQPTREARARLEAALRRQRFRKYIADREQLLGIAQAAAEAVTWDWDLVTDAIPPSPRWGDVLGLPALSRFTTGAEFLSAVHPADLPGLRMAIDGAMKRGDRFHAEFRFVRSDGSTKWVRATGGVQYDSGGKPLRMIGVTMDIHRRQTAEMAIRSVVEGVGSATGDDFFGALARSLAETTGVRCVVVAEVEQDDAGTAHVLAAWDRGRLLERFSYSTDRTPCARTLAEGGLVVRHGVQDAFPACGLLKHLGAESYAGAALTDGQGRPLGLLAAIHGSPLEEDAGGVLVLLRMFADRAAAELVRMRAERSLRVSERRYRVLHDANPLMIFTLDRAGTILDVNQAGARRLGFEVHDLRDRSVLELFEPVHHEAIREQLRRCFEHPGEVMQWAGTKRHRSGRAMEVEELATLIPDVSGSGSVLLVVCADVTERRAAETTLRRQEEQLRLGQKMEALGTLAAGVAHDINNLLTAIRGYASLASHTLGEGHPAVENLGHVEEAARQASAVAGSLLTFARRGSPIKKPVAISGVVASAARLLKRALPGGTTLTVDVERAQGLMVLADEAQLHQLVMNLGLNARDAVKDGGQVDIRVAPVEGGAAGVRLTCRDTGVGMPREVRLRAFEPFFTTKSPEEGAGLGLSIVHGIVTEHGGTIEVASEPGQGTEFTVWLPTLPTAEPTPIRLGGRAVVIEPHQVVRGLLGSMLGALGYEVTLGESVGAVSHAVGRGPVDLVVTSVWPIDQPPQSLLSRLRARGAAPTVLFIGDGGEGAPREPGVGLLRRPFQLNTLRAVLEERVRTGGGGLS